MAWVLLGGKGAEAAGRSGLTAWAAYAAGDHVLVTGSFESPPRVKGELPAGRRPIELVAQKVVLIGNSGSPCEFAGEQHDGLAGDGRGRP